MKFIAKIFAILILIALANLGASNTDSVILKIWPYINASMNLGVFLVIISLLAFFSGGLYMWLYSVTELKKNLREAKKRIKSLEKQLKESENNK